MTDFRCPACGFRIFNRSHPRCEGCGKPLPAELLLSPEQITRRRQAEAEQRAERSSGSASGDFSPNVPLEILNWII